MKYTASTSYDNLMNHFYNSNNKGLKCKFFPACLSSAINLESSPETRSGKIDIYGGGSPRYIEFELTNRVSKGYITIAIGTKQNYACTIFGIDVKGTEQQFREWSYNDRKATGKNVLIYYLAKGGSLDGGVGNAHTHAGSDSKYEPYVICSQQHYRGLNGQSDDFYYFGNVYVGTLAKGKHSFCIGLDGNNKHTSGIYEIHFAVYDAVPEVPNPKEISGMQKNRTKILEPSGHTFNYRDVSAGNTAVSVGTVKPNSKMNHSVNNWFYAHGHKYGEKEDFIGQMEYADFVNQYNLDKVHTQSTLGVIQNLNKRIATSLKTTWVQWDQHNNKDPKNGTEILDIRAPVEDKWDIDWEGFVGATNFADEFFVNNPAYFRFVVATSGNYRIRGFVGCFFYKNISDSRIRAATTSNTFFAGWGGLYISNGSHYFTEDIEGVKIRVKNAQPIWVRAGACHYDPWGSTVYSVPGANGNFFYDSISKSNIKYRSAVSNPYISQTGVYNYIDRIITFKGNKEYILIYAGSSGVGLYDNLGGKEYKIHGLTDIHLTFEKLPEDNEDFNRPHGYRPDSWTDWNGSTYTIANKTDRWDRENNMYELSGWNDDGYTWTP